jgi:transcriptional regulator
MYTPDIYKNENQEEIKHLFKKIALVSNQSNGRKLCATHIPLELEDN